MGREFTPAERSAICAATAAAIDRGTIVGLADPGADLAFSQPGFRTSSEAIHAFFAVLRAVQSRPSLSGEVERLLLDPGRRDGAFVTHLAVNGVLFSYPSKGFLDAIAAVLAWNFDGDEVELTERHGWPILSLREASATIAGEGDADQRALPGDVSEAEAA